MTNRFVPGVAAAGLLVLVAGASACAGRVHPTRPATAVPPALTSAAPTLDAREQIQRGCFDCLKSALDTARAVEARETAYEAASLLALRAKEVGMPADPWLEQAASLRPDGVQWAVYDEIVAAVPPDPLGGDREELLQRTVPRRQVQASLALWRNSLRLGPASDVFRAYLDLALACPFGTPDEWTTAVADVTARLRDVPLLEFRIGFCGVDGDTPRLVRLRAEHPEYAEADYALGRLAAQGGDGADEGEAVRRFRAAAAAFPTSSAILSSLGQVLESQEEWADALAAHDAALALVPTHRDSLLGRTIALSNLLRRDDAIAAATRLLDLGSWFVGQAFYWRAWNHFHLERYGPARFDADGAKSAMRDPAVLVLSGMIEWRERRLDTAEADFVEARRVDGQQCEAASFLGAVRAERGRFADALATFVEARQCFEALIVERRAAIEQVEASRVAEDTKRRQTAAHERTIADARTRLDEATVNESRLRQRLESLGRTQPGADRR